MIDYFNDPENRWCLLRNGERCDSTDYTSWRTANERRRGMNVLSRGEWGAGIGVITPDGKLHDVTDLVIDENEREQGALWAEHHSDVPPFRRKETEQ